MKYNFEKRIFNDSFEKKFSIICGESPNDDYKKKFIFQIFKSKFWPTSTIFGKNYSSIDDSLNLPDEKYILPQTRNRVNNEIIEPNFEIFKNHRVAILLDTCQTNINFYSNVLIDAILSESPFMIIAEGNELDKMKQDGFITFDFFIDESYNQESDINKRIKKAKEEMEKIFHIKEDHWSNINQAMEHISEHNRLNLLKKFE